VTVVGKPNQIVASAKKMVEGEPLTLTATASGTVLSFGWDVNHDGTVDVSSDAYPYQGDPSRSFGTITISWSELQEKTQGTLKPILDNGEYSASVHVTYAPSNLASAGVVVNGVVVNPVISMPFIVSVANAAPTGKLTNSGPVKQGQPVQISFTDVSDPSGAGSEGMVYSFDFNGDGIYEVKDSTSPTAIAPANFQGLAGSHIVYGKITDKDGGSVVLSTIVELTDGLPTITVTGKKIANQGETYQLGLHYSNPGKHPVIEWLVNWGDGNATRTHVEKPTLTHVYKDNSEYTISITAMDADGLAAKVYVTIQNGTVGAATVTAPEAGTLDVVADGSDIVVKTETDELFRILATEIQRLNIMGTPGDDTFNLGKLGAIFAGLVYFEAGAGKDTLRLTGSGQALDLTSIAQALRGIETIDIIGGGNNSLKLDFSAVLALAESTQTLRVRHDASSIIEFGNGWTTEKPKILDNQFVHVLSQNNAKIEIVNSRPYHNPLLPLDVTANGRVDPIDVLVVINLLNRFSRPELPSDGPKTSEELAAFQYYDADGDGNISPLDVLSIINRLNGGGGNAEGEFVANPNVAITSFTQFAYGSYGHDHFQGGNGNDILVGRSSKDKQQGEDSNYQLIGGSTENLDDLTSFDAALEDWCSDLDLASFNPRDVEDDDEEDSLNYEEEFDLYFSAFGDKFI
jgi:hypothetical protein